MGRTSHPSLVSSLSLVFLPSLVSFLLLIYFSSFLIKKKKIPPLICLFSNCLNMDAACLKREVIGKGRTV